ARPDMVLKLWAGLGYYTRARNLHAAARILVTDHAGEFPRDYAQILALPGIGRYTAGAIASIAFNQSRPIPDGNVIRGLTRCFGITANPKEKRVADELWALATHLVEAAAGCRRAPDAAALAPFVSAGPCSLLNQALMELGATVCAPRQPRCDACPLRRSCWAHQTGRTE